MPLTPLEKILNDGKLTAIFTKHATGKYHSESTFISDIKSFLIETIKQRDREWELEKAHAYADGLHKGYEEESFKCHEHCEKARKEAFIEVTELCERIRSRYKGNRLTCRRESMANLIASELQEELKTK